VAIVALAQYQQLAVDFARALVDGDFARAKEMLGPPLSDSMSDADLRDHFDGMYRGYADDDRPSKVWFDPEFSGEDWPAICPGDLGWAYVAVQGEECVEAVTVFVAELKGRMFIRDIEWGRP
jgi:hypothetical protein